MPDAAAPSAATRTPAIDDAPHDITPLLEWAERDERDGHGDMPYPPDHPKMPGEPMRVQPSRARRPVAAPGPCTVT